MKKENGITLIALVITIIVMLILVGVSVTVALNGGLFTTAKEAAEGTASKRNEELELSSGKVTINGEEYNSIDEYVNGSENGTGEQKVAITPKKETYTVGEPVKIGEENFYVIADDANKVTLLAKDCIDTSTLVQSASADKPAFSSTNYWMSEEEAEDYNNVYSEETYNAYMEKWGSTYPRNLNDIPTSADTDAIAKARVYGTNLGGTGRLMTYEEAEALETANSDILYGTNGKSSSEYLYFWLGSAYSADNVGRGVGCVWRLLRHRQHQLRQWRRLWGPPSCRNLEIFNLIAPKVILDVNNDSI